MEQLRGKRLLILGGSLWKDAIRDFADRYGITLIATGNDTSAGIFQIADETYTVNSTDADAMKRLILEKKIDGVYMGGSEAVIGCACRYLAQLGLPCYCTCEQWEYLQNKANFKELCIRNGLPVVPRYFADEDGTVSIPDTDFPVITKPTDGCGSNGFSVCHNREQLKDGMERARLASPTGQVIVEKFVPNDGVVVFYTVSKGKLLFSGLEDKYPVRYEKQGSYVGGLFICESDLAASFRAEFEEKIQKMIHSIGIKEGSFWIEVFHEGEAYYFNEVGFRYGGSASIYFVDYKHGINQVGADIYYALTGKSKTTDFPSLIPASVPRNLLYAVYPVYVRSGIIADIQGDEKIRAMKNVVILPIIHPVGTRVADSGSFSQVCALVHFVFSTEDELRLTLHTIHKTLRISDAKGDNMILRMLNPDTLRLKHFPEEVSS